MGEALDPVHVKAALLSSSLGVDGAGHVGVMRFCLDTSAYSHFKRGDPQVVDLIDRADWLGVPVIVRGELAVGFRQGSRAETNQAELDRFVSNPAVLHPDKRCCSPNGLPPTYRTASVAVVIGRGS